LTAYLYVLSIGPVQDFIAAARRTRDLWFGSHLLSEISKAAAREISKSGGKLVFPNLECGDKDLEPSDSMDAFNVSNIILAELPHEPGPAIVDINAQKAAEKQWKRSAEQARKLAGGAIRCDIWNDQIDDVIEFNSAWISPKEKEEYRETRKRLMRLLAGRKSIRDFKPAKGRSGIPKSSLDGARESVLKNGKELPKWLALRMRLSKGEQLCAVGLTKRLGGGRVPFPSVVRVAADPWIRSIKNSKRNDAYQLLDEIRDLCKVPCKLPGRTDCEYQPLNPECRLCNGENSFSSGTGKRLYQDFPFDGQIFYLSRLNRAREKKDIIEVSLDISEANPYKEDLKKLNQIEEKVHRLQRKHDGGFGFGEPTPYFAILVADGDHMGKALSKIESAEKHRKFSTSLSEFASKARNITEKLNGCMVFSGGDDVLAFLPVDRCLDAARDLHDEFGKLRFSDEGEKRIHLTLSVGIAIAHCTEPLEDILMFGRAAERDAKNPDRNALAVHIHTRSGGDPILLREQWKEKGENGLDERLKSWVKMHRINELPDKAAYDLRQLAEEYSNWPSISHDLLKRDVRRLLRRKRAGRGKEEISDSNLEKIMNDVKSRDDLIHRANELILARSIAEVEEIAQAFSPTEDLV